MRPRSLLPGAAAFCWAGWSLPGQFSGLNLVARMYVAAQQRAPGLDVGFDLAQEYAMAWDWGCMWVGDAEVTGKADVFIYGGCVSWPGGRVNSRCDTSRWVATRVRGPA